MNNNNQPILSLCLPTNGAVHWVIPTLEGIYSQGVDASLFEVVITDNGEDSRLGEALLQYDYPNLRYIPTKDKGFTNLITALKLGKGLYCKMINHRSVLVPGALQMMIDLVEKYREEKPILYFSNGYLDDKEIVECPSVDAFVYSMHYLATWSAGVGLWQVDNAKLNDIQLNDLFPQSALMFDLREESAYVICNREFQKMQDEEGKGGYDLFYAFAVEFPNIWKALLTQKRISTATYEYVMKKMYGFIYSLYCQEVLHKSKHTFIIQDVAKSIMVNYGLKGYLRIVIESRVNQVKRKIKKLL